MTATIFSFGINDLLQEYRESGLIMDNCPYYKVWRQMIRRCNDSKYKSRNPTYSECKVCEDWRLFSNFKCWMAKQDFHGKDLDKDLLIRGNKTYSPDTCAFIHRKVNKFVTDRHSGRLLITDGVYWHKVRCKFYASCNNPFTGKLEHIGSFNCEVEAGTASKRRKHELACQLADLQTDDRVANALRARYL